MTEYPNRGTGGVEVFSPHADGFISALPPPAVRVVALHKSRI